MSREKTIDAYFEFPAEIEASLLLPKKIMAETYKATESGTSDYEFLKHLPTLNGEKIIGNKFSKDYKIADEGIELNILQIAELFN